MPKKLPGTSRVNFDFKRLSTIVRGVVARFGENCFNRFKMRIRF